MKTQLVFLILGAGAWLAAIPEAGALPPAAHPETGVVTAIDYASRSISIRTKSGAGPKLFVWNDRTRFSHGGCCVQSRIEQGQSVRVYYRREYGRNVLREVTARSVSSACRASPK
jgi:hypothetical protein